MRGVKKAKRLAEAGVEKIGAPKRGRREVADALTPGLVLRVTHRGAKSWSVSYRVPGEGGFTHSGRALRGKQHRITLGSYPALSLKEARRQARGIMEKVAGGTNPAPERRAAVEARYTNSVRSVSERMIDMARKDVPASVGKIESTLRLHVWDEWGDRPIADISTADIHGLLDKLVAADRKAVAREVRKHLSRLMNFAASRGLIQASPMTGIRRRELAYPKGDRVLSDEELRAVWAATEKMGYPFGVGYRLLILTGQRRCEWFHATRGEIDDAEQLLIIPALRYKTRRQHIVPLAPTAWSIVEQLPRWNFGDFLFSTTNGAKAVSGFDKAAKRLSQLALKTFCKERDAERAAVMEHFTPHDFRRTCETRLAKMGVGQEVRDAVLGHTQSGMQSIYNRYSYLEEKREALAAYADHVREVVR